MTNVDILISLGIQFPLLVLFIIYNERKDKQFQEFLTNQRKEFIAALDKISLQQEEHNQATTQAIARMEERTRPRPINP